MTVKGTPRYMAPEAHKGTLSTAMDVFSFGVVILEMISGLPSFAQYEGMNFKTDIVSSNKFND